MTPGEASRCMLRKAKSLQPNMRTAISKTLTKGIVIAHRWSSGPLSSSQLAAMGHPYATRAGAGPPPDPIGRINRQGGDFYRDWQKQPILASSGTVFGGFFNSASYAKWLQDGTSRMVARPITSLIRTDLRPVFRDNVRAGVRKSISTR